MTDLVFVYGTLLPGERRWPLLAPYAASWLDADADGTLWDTGRGYPAAVFAPGGKVSGAVVRLVPALSARAVELLDAIEGEGTLYRRVVVATSGGPALAYEWMGPTEGLRRLPGAWRDR